MPSLASRVSRGTACWLLLAALALAGGCRSVSHSAPQSKLAPPGLAHGYTLLLPGTLGHNFWDDNVVRGLKHAGVRSAIEVHDWTRGPHLMLVNMFDVDYRQRELDAIVGKIVRYQDEYPGRPVTLIGHSGGARMAITAVENLPPGRKVTNVVLLAAPLGRTYDLRPAQSRTLAGIHNFHSPYDVFIGLAWSGAFATLEGDIASASTFGFADPKDLDEQERQRYRQQLIEHPFSWEMMQAGNTGGHFGWTNPEFVATYVAPIVDPTAVPQGNGAGDLLPAALPRNPISTASHREEPPAWPADWDN